jgi:hypothetical protein
VRTLCAVASLLAVVACGGEAAVPSAPQPDAIIASMRFGFKACFQAALNEDPTAEGRVVLRLDMAADASVEVRERNGNLPAATAECLAEVVRAYPWASSGRTEPLTIPITLRRAK